MTTTYVAAASLLLVVLAMGCVRTSRSGEPAQPSLPRILGGTTQWRTHATARALALASEPLFDLRFKEVRLVSGTILLVGRPSGEQGSSGGAGVTEFRDQAVRAERAARRTLGDLRGPGQAGRVAPPPLVVIMLPSRSVLGQFAARLEGIERADRTGGYWVEGPLPDTTDVEDHLAGFSPWRAHAAVAAGEVGVLAHEMTHGHLARLGLRGQGDSAGAGRRLIPVWLDEGLSEQSRLTALAPHRARNVRRRARDLSAALVKVKDPRARLSALVGRTNLHPADRSGYALSIAFVGWLHERLGAGGLQGLTRLYLAARRRPLEEALGVADLEAAEALWWQWLGVSSRAMVEVPGGVTR